jgi:hypothetical protein
MIVMATSYVVAAVGTIARLGFLPPFFPVSFQDGQLGQLALLGRQFLRGRADFCF